MPNLSGFENFYCRPYGREVCNKKGLGPPGGWGNLTKFNTGKLRPEVQPLTLLYTVLASFMVPFIEKKVPLSDTYVRKSCSYFHVVLNK